MWKQLPNFSKYQINQDGIVRNIKTGNNLKARLVISERNRKGYYYFDMYNDAGNKKSLKRSRILAYLFVANPDNKPEVDHINENTHDDSIQNLQWVSRQENCAKTATSRNHSLYTSVETEKVVLAMRESGMSYSKIKEATGIPVSTISRLVNSVNKGSTTRT